MRILLLDDSLKHRRAGVRQLKEKGHEVVAFCDYTEALTAARKEQFDAALIDLLMPAEGTTLGPAACAEWLGKEIAVGFPLVFALSMVGIKMIGVLTDTNHHAHPMSAAVDWFHGQTMQVNGATVAIQHARLSVEGAKDWSELLDWLVVHS